MIFNVHSEMIFNVHSEMIFNVHSEMIFNVHSEMQNLSSCCALRIYNYKQARGDQNNILHDVHKVPSVAITCFAQLNIIV